MSGCCSRWYLVTVEEPPEELLVVVCVEIVQVRVGVRPLLRVVVSMMMTVPVLLLARIDVPAFRRPATIFLIALRSAWNSAA